MTEKPEPNRKVTVADYDISQYAITTRIELRENAINMAILTAENEDAVNYLAHLKPNDEVKVKMIADSNPPYSVTPIEWDTDPLVKTVFRGRVQELSPILNKAGQVCSVIAYGHGFQLKEMRVNKKYGAIVPLPSIGNTYSYDNTYEEWIGSGTSPYIKDYRPSNGYLLQYYWDNISCVLHGIINQEMGAFTLMIDPEYDGVEFDTAELHIVGGLWGNITSVDITPYYSIDNGLHWIAFIGFFEGIPYNKRFVITTHLSNNPRTSAGWSDDTGYNPVTNTPPPPKGQDDYIDIVSNIPFWNKNVIIKLKITSVSDPSYNDEVSIKYMWLKYTFKTNQGKTVRQLLAGDAYTTGIIENFVNNILDTGVSSGYSPTINTDYVYGYTETEDEYKIPYIAFPYEDALTSVQDIIKYASGLKFLQSASGYHWILVPDDNDPPTYIYLLVAPVNNHSVYGKSGSELISSKWTLQPYATAIKVKQDMVTQAFKQEVPLANYVLIAGRYKYPLNDEISKGLDIGLWQTAGGIGAGTRKIYLDTYDVASIGACLHMEGCYNPIAAVNNIYAYPLPTDLNLTKLMGEKANPSVFFIFKVGGLTADYEFRLYFDKDGSPDIDNYFRYAFTGMQTDTWVAKEIELPNTIYYKNFKGWELVTNDGTKDWKDIEDVKYFAFRYNSTVGAIGVTYCKVFGLSFNGTVIYGMYDSHSIKPIAEGGLGYGCRMITIKDTYALTDTLDINEIANTPLGLECLYELVRYRKLRTTGEIAIPLDPIWMAGQQVWLQAEWFNPDPINFPNGIYKIDKWFRISKVTHEFNATGALTRLQVTDDMESSIPIDSTDPYVVIMRAINIDFQSRTTGSLKSSTDFDQGLTPITLDHPS